MTIKDRLWVIADLARKLIENDGAGANYDALKASSARGALREELDELEAWKKRRLARSRKVVKLGTKKSTKGRELCN